MNNTVQTNDIMAMMGNPVFTPLKEGKYKCKIEKVGINADIVAASKGRINMFTMFNLDKKQKLEDVKIVSIAKEGVVDATKNLFLLENESGKPKTEGKAELRH